ncbi:MAG: PAS domain S-box protein [Candidatus Hermodarchaeota archaeon]
MTSIEKSKEDESIYSNLLETIDVGFYSVTIDGQMLIHNKAHNTILGYDPSKSLEALDVRKFWQNPKDRDIYVEHLLKHGFTKDYICNALKKDGTKIIVELNSRLIKDNNGRPIRIDGTFIDITEKYNLRRKLEESEEKYRDLVNRIPDLLLELDLKGKFTYASPQLYDIFGFNPSEIIGKRFHKFVHPDDIPEAAEAMKKAFETKEQITLEYRTIHKDGHYVFVSAKGSFLENGRFYGVVRDISDTKTMEQRLRESEEKYRLISETAYDLIGILNNKFKYEYINETAFRQILGYSNKDLIGKSALEFTHPNDIASTAKALTDGFKHGKGGAELRFRHKDGKWVWIEAKGKTYVDKDGKIKAIVISRDISERKITERRLKESETKYREAYNRANFYQDLFAHDINNILHIISSSMELISYSLTNSEKSMMILEAEDIINKQIERGAKLVSNVHTLSKLEEEEIHTQPTEICKLMKNAIEFVKKTYNGKVIKINIECEDDNIIINANELLQGVFENIFLNAIKYNENSEIIISIEVSITLLDNNSYYKIEFVDNGIGVPDDRKQIIFQQGNRELKGTKGMGLGLSLVKKILKTFNGKIWVEDRIKNDFTQGSNFIILLPEFEQN